MPVRSLIHLVPYQCWTYYGSLYPGYNPNSNQGICLRYHLNSYPRLYSVWIVLSFTALLLLPYYPSVNGKWSLRTKIQNSSFQLEVPSELAEPTSFQWSSWLASDRTIKKISVSDSFKDAGSRFSSTLDSILKTLGISREMCPTM